MAQKGNSTLQRVAQKTLAIVYLLWSGIVSTTIVRLQGATEHFPAGDTIRLRHCKSYRVDNPLNTDRWTYLLLLKIPRGRSHVGNDRIEWVNHPCGVYRVNPNVFLGYRRLFQVLTTLALWRFQWPDYNLKHWVFFGSLDAVEILIHSKIFGNPKS